MEPERRIEKWLRAFAKKRREQAGDPMELHRVARQQLQKEIARRAAGTRGGAWFSSFFLRPRLAFAICFIVLAVGGLILVPNFIEPKPSKLASANVSRKEMVPAEKTLPALQPPPVSTVAPVAADEGTRAAQDKQPAVFDSLAMEGRQSEPTGANRQQVIAPTETPKQAELLKSTIAQTEASADVIVASAPRSNKEMFAFKDDASVVNSLGGAGALSKDAGAQPAPSAPPSTTRFAVITNGATLAANEDARKKLNLQKQSVPPATVSADFFNRSKSESAAVIPPVSQAFNRSDILVARRRNADTLNGSSAVLLSFRVEQTGNAMRVVDADGSVYTGAVQLAPEAGATRAVAAKNTPSAAPAGGATAPSRAAQNYFFRVAGTNRNLKQNVVFSGNLIPLTNAPLLLYGAGGGGFGGAPAAQRPAELPAELLLSNSRISGTATIGDQKEIEVMATPAP